MADTKAGKGQSSGFALPPPTTTSEPQKSPDAGKTTGTTPPPEIDVSTTSSGPKDMMIGGAILFVLIIAFLFAKNAYANMLVGKRVEPRSANAAGWWLWILLTLLALVGIIGAMNQPMLMAPFVAGPLALGAIIALVLMLISSKR